MAFLYNLTDYWLNSTVMFILIVNLKKTIYGVFSHKLAQFYFVLIFLFLVVQILCFQLLLFSHCCCLFCCI